MIIKITMGILLLSIIVFVIRLILIKDLYDKLMTLNLLIVKVLLFLSVYAAYTHDKFILDIVLASSLVGFISTAILITYYGRNEKA